MLSFASTPPTSTITVPTTIGQTVTVTWTGTIPPLVNGTSDCSALADTPAVDQHVPTIVVPNNVYNTVNAKFTFNISWDEAAGNDEILTVVKPDGTVLDSSDGGDPTETVTGINLPGGAYKVIACGFISGPTPQTYVGKLTIDTSSGVAPPPPTPTPTPSFAGGPRYYNYVAPQAVGEAAGEPSIGYNLTTHKAMYIAGLETFRVTFPETGACEALWEDVSFLGTSVKSLDPILFTDQTTGRTFVSQLNSVVPPASPVLIGLNSLMAYTDDDGANWVPAQINPPDGSYDHQTVGAGPYPASVPLGNAALNKGSAVYYCSQAGVTAFCSRSDDGGINFGPSRAVYNSVTDGCSAIHGHVKVGPDGTVYLPNRGCNGVQSVTVSDNAGLTWTVRQVKNNNFSAGGPPGILDPSVAVANDSNTLYFSYINSDGHAHAAVSHDKGVTWVNDHDLGVAHNIANAVFVEAVAGDPMRAAVGFLGTTQTGDHQAADFNGDWYLYIAHTYDGGNTWTTVNATPNDPVQRSACIWNQGGANACRNLLDFNEITADEKGRVLYSYSDGCIGDCVTGGPNSYSSKATIARQSGGKGLLAAYDPVEPVAPQSPCLSGRRDDQASYLRWIAPDNGGSDVTVYKILRGLTPGTEVEIGQQVGNKTTYTDRGADPNVASYSYKIIAMNAQGAGPASNNVVLTVQPRVEATGACSVPGVEVLGDPIGDNSDHVTQHDITSVSVSEPLDNATTGAASKIYFTIKVSDLATPIAPGWRWSIRFTVPNFNPPAHPVLGAQEDWHVSMDTSSGPTPVFTYGTTGVFQGASRFFVTLGNLDSASNAREDGTITLVLPKSVFAGIQPGQPINIALASVRATAPSAIPGTGGTNETIPDTTGGTSYVLRPTNLCLPNTAPFASLSANPTSGPQGVTVNFNGSASTDDDAIDSIATYTFNFGDGGDDVVQNTPTISHQFPNAGLYDVKLVVTDSRGKVSSNTAHQLIDVQQAFGTAKIVSRRNHSTAGDFDIDLPLTGTAGVECRMPGSQNTYNLIYTFNRDIAVPGTATKTQGNAIVGVPTLGPNPNQVMVPVRSVTNAQHLVISLSGVQSTVGDILNNQVARMDVLLGDVTGNGAVSNTDVAAVKGQVSATLSASTFRTDVTANGAVSNTDVSTTKAQVGTTLP
ncbi:MAG TPA: PKD domain-containing protein [Chthoniobacterales bacterium]|nr:PKD domain-containing protein [Chthoniobacterales bacterium]